MSEATPLIIFVTLSLLIAFVLTPIILYVAPTYNTTALNGTLGFFNATVNADVEIGAGWFTATVNLVPFQSLRDFLSDQILAWSYLPNALMIILSSGLIVGGIYALIKALPTT